MPAPRDRTRQGRISRRQVNDPFVVRTFGHDAGDFRLWDPDTGTHECINPACQRRQRAGIAFCWPCWYALPEGTRSNIRTAKDRPAAFRAAVQYLRIRARLGELASAG